MPTSKKDATEVFRSHLAGDPKATAELSSCLYGELRALAGRAMRDERRDHTLQATALVHEAYLRLIDGDRIDWQERSQFLRIAAVTLRRVLIDHARGRGAQKRRGVRQQIRCPEQAGSDGADPIDVMALHEALAKLSRRSERQAKLVELRFFGGLTVQEAAAALEISKESAKDDWRLARAWLNRELGKGA